MADKSVRVRLFADVGQYQAKLAAAAQSTRKFATDANTNLGRAGQQFEKLGLSAGTMKLGVAAAALAAGRSIFEFSRKATEAQSALNEQMSASSVIFGSASAEVSRFAERAATDLFMSERAALQASNGFAQMLQNVGLTDQSIAGMSTTLTSLAGDLASQYDVPMEDTIRRLQSGLAGETEAVRRFGADLSEANVKTKALELGLGGMGRELTHGEKLMTRYSILVKSTATAHGDLARTSASLANQQRRLAAERENLEANFGRTTAPGKTGLMQGFGNQLEFINRNLGGGDDADGMGLLERAQFAGGRGASAAWRGNYWGELIRGWNDSGKAAEEATGPASKFADAIARYNAAVVDGKGDSAEAAAALADVRRFAGQAASEQDRLAEATMTSADRFAQQRAAIQDVHDRMMAVPSAQRSLTTAGLDLADAQDAVASKQRELNELMQRGPIDTEALAAARDRLASATHGVDEAEERLADARQRVVDLERQAPLRAEELAVARARAQQEIAAAERRLSAVKAAGGSPTAVAEAETNLRDARLELSQLDEKAIDQARDLENARGDVTDASRDVAKAQSDERKAIEEVVRASQADEDWTRRVEKVKRDLERAVIAVDAAEDNLVGATWNLRDALDQQNTPLNTNVQLMGQLRQHYERMVELSPSLAPLLGLPNVAPQQKLMLEGARAGGGPVWPGRWLVGENGPEFLQLGAGGRGHVTPAPQTAQMIRQSNTTSDASMSIGTVVIQDNTDRALRRLQRSRRLANLAAV